MFLDVINNHLQLKYTTKDKVDSLLWKSFSSGKTTDTGTEGLKMDETGKITATEIKYNNQTKWLSNFEKNDDFWHVISTSSIELVYNRKQYYYSQWDQFLGPLTLSKYDKFQIQFNCMEGSYISFKTYTLNMNFRAWRLSTGVLW